MKKTLFLVLLTVFAVSIAACGGGGGGNEGTPSTATVIMQLINSGSNYPVNLMTISIQKSGGPVLTGFTHNDGVARISVSETGTYQVLKIDGVDASNLSLFNDTGREFVKSNPITDPYPSLTFTFTGLTVDVTALEEDYFINLNVPKINKVSVLKTGSLVSNGTGGIQTGVSDFSGRIMLSNFSFGDADGQIVIHSFNSNYMLLYADATQISSARVFTENATLGYTSSYTSAGPVYFEAPGTDSGDWSLGCNLSSIDVKTRQTLGGANAARNFPMFYGGDDLGKFIISISSDTGGSTHSYNFDYRIFKFTAFL
jgi:hypothetical protein